MSKLLTFHIHEAGDNTQMSPAYFMDGEYDKVSVRIYAERAPVRNATIDIYDDGVSIFSNSTPTMYNVSSGADETDASNTLAILPKGYNSEEMAEDFTPDTIEEESWITCKLIDGAGGRNFTVQLELSQVSEDESGDD